MFWIELVILLLLIAWGVRKGGVFLTLAGGIGAFVLTFIFKAPMSDPPLTVLRIILTVVIAGGAMQAAGGIEYLVALAEKFGVDDVFTLPVLTDDIEFRQCLNCFLHRVNRARSFRPFQV